MTARAVLAKQRLTVRDVTASGPDIREVLFHQSVFLGVPSRVGGKDFSSPFLERLTAGREQSLPNAGAQVALGQIARLHAIEQKFYPGGTTEQDFGGAFAQLRRETR